MLEIILALIGVSGIIVGAVFTYINSRRSNDLKAIELKLATQQQSLDEEARKRKEASEKHAGDMQRVAALEARYDAQEASLDRLRSRYALLFQHALQLMQHINEGKGPPPPEFPEALLD